MISIDTIYGEIHAPNWPDDLIVKSLSMYGEWAYCEQLLFSPLLRSGDALWDGGAFLGTFGLGAAQIACNSGNPLSKLVAIDPSAQLYPYLVENLTRNSPCNFDVVSLAVGQQFGLLQAGASCASDSTDTALNHGAVAYRKATSGSSVDTVEGKALWQLRESYGFYDAIKLDLEGMEAEALVGDFEYIKTHKPLIWSECNESAESLRLLEVLVSAGYDPIYLAFPSFRKRNYRGETSPLFPMAYEAGLLVGSPERLRDLNTDCAGEIILSQSVRTSWDLRQALWHTPRWANPEWVNLTQPELIALLGHLSQGTNLGDFLNV